MARPITGDVVYCWPIDRQPPLDRVMVQAIGHIVEIEDDTMRLVYLLPDGTQGITIVPIESAEQLLVDEDADELRARYKGRWWPRPERR